MPSLGTFRPAAPTGAAILLCCAGLTFPGASFPGTTVSGQAHAQALPDSAAFIVRLGTDTVAIERWVHTADRLDAVSVTRSPRTVLRRYSVRFDGGGRAIAVTVGDAAEREIEPAGAIPLAGGFQAPFALALRQAAHTAAETSVQTMLVGQNAREFTVQRNADGTYTMPNQFGVPMQVQLGPDGTLLSIDAGGGNTVERTAWLDIEALAREFAARDERGAGLGPLSPRDTVHAEVGGAAISIDYSRPSARGRPVMGGLVPYDEVWRTGANNATQLIIDRPVVIGEIALQPGSYSLFTVPGRDSWELIVNSQTGMSGLARDAAHDVGRTAMQVRDLASHVETFTIAVEPAGAGAELAIRWGTREARVPLRVPQEQDAPR
jgi:hypothetical protein